MYKFTNLFTTTLNGAINNSQTSITLTSASGLPTIGPGEKFSLTITDGTNTEEVTVTDDASTPTFTVTRNADGRGAFSFADGSIVEQRPTATQMAAFIQLLLGTSNKITVTDNGGGSWTINIADNPIFGGSNGATLPQGSNASRPSSSVFGRIRANTSLGNFEWDSSGGWQLVPRMPESMTTNALVKCSSSNVALFTVTGVLIDNSDNISGFNNIVFSNGYLAKSVQTGITASTTQTQGQGALTRDINQISTVTNPNDVVTAPTALGGREIVIINSGANTLQVFPASGDNLGAGVDTSITISAGAAKKFIAYDSTNWVEI